jgi:hypothetical protein
MEEPNMAALTAADKPAQSTELFRVLSNLSRLPEQVKPECRLENNYIDTASRPVANSLLAFLRSFTCDAIVLYEPTGDLFILCALLALVPFRRTRLVVVDLILTKPADTLAARVKAFVKRMLLRRVDLYILHIKDVEGLQWHYGISPNKVRYIPYKVNSWQNIPDVRTSEGDYVFTGGKSRRDYTTFCRAMSPLTYPSVILTPQAGENAYHGTQFRQRDLPLHIRTIHDDGTPESWIRHMAHARLVVLCIAPESLSASGIGTYVLAMALKKCVIITDSPATKGILEHEKQAILVPMQDPAALAQAVRRAWEDDAYRHRIAAQGYAYAMSLGGEDALRGNIARAAVDFLQGGRRLKKPGLAACGLAVAPR